MILMRKLRLSLLLTLAIFVLGAVIVEEVFAAAWFNDNWLYRKQITIDHTKVEDVADPSTTYADFPLLVFATGLSNINANGTDIRFTSSDGTTELPREIESYSGGTLYAWVKVTLTKDSSDSMDDVIFMYYGNSAATEPAPGSTYGSENVWDSNYKMVQHLQETSGQHLDSTSNDNDSTALQVTTQGSATAQIGGADQFVKANNDYISVPDDDSLDIIGSITIEAWINPDNNDAANFYGIVQKNLGSTGYRFSFNAGDCMGGRELSAKYGDSGLLCSNVNVITLDVYQHVALVSDGSDVNFYVNGEAAGSNPGVMTSNAANAINLYIGNWTAGGGTQNFDGLIDEVRISNTNRSLGWIKISYNNQNNPSSFLTFSEQVSIPTMTQWGMIIFIVLAGLGSIYYLPAGRQV